MTKDSAIAWFVKWVLPAIENKEDGERDLPLRIVAWSEYTDALFKEGKITKDQFISWTIPNSIEFAA